MPDEAEETAGEETPVHPAAHLGKRARDLFDLIVEETSIRRRRTKTLDMLVDNGLVYDRSAGWDEYGQEVFDLSARIEAWDAYSAYLDHQDKLTEEPAPAMGMK